MKQELTYKFDLIQKHRNDPQIRGSFFKFLKHYRRSRKSKMRKYKENILKQLDKFENENPKAYWDLLKN